MATVLAAQPASDRALRVVFTMVLITTLSATQTELVIESNTHGFHEVSHRPGVVETQWGDTIDNDSRVLGRGDLISCRHRGRSLGVHCFFESKAWCKVWCAGKKNFFDAFVVIVVVALKLALSLG